MDACGVSGFEEGRKRGEKNTEKEREREKNNGENGKKKKNAPTPATASESLRTWPINTSLILEASPVPAAPEADAACLRSATVASSGEGSSTEKAADATGLMVIFIFSFFSLLEVAEKKNNSPTGEWRKEKKKRLEVFFSSSLLLPLFHFWGSRSSSSALFDGPGKKRRRPRHEQRREKETRGAGRARESNDETAMGGGNRVGEQK